MITQTRMNQFEYLLSTILDFTKIGISVRHACIYSFFNTAEYYNIKETTVRDMVTRSCKSNTDYFYSSIFNLFYGNIYNFKNKYYTYIPTNWHKKIDSICNEFTNSGINPQIDQSPEEYIQLLNVFVKGSLDEKRMIIKILKNQK